MEVNLINIVFWSSSSGSNPTSSTLAEKREKYGEGSVWLGVAT